MQVLCPWQCTRLLFPRLRQTWLLTYVPGLSRSICWPKNQHNGRRNERWSACSVWGRCKSPAHVTLRCGMGSTFERTNDLGHTKLTLPSILGVAAGRCVSNGSTAQVAPDPFWNFPTIVLLGESENRLACILGSIPVFWPVVQEAADRVHELYRIYVTQEFVVQSSRVLPGEVTVEIGAYEAPHWAEQAGDAPRSINEDYYEQSSLPEWPETPPGTSTAEPKKTSTVKEEQVAGDESV